MIGSSHHPSACGHLAAVLRLLILCAFILPGGPTFAHEVRPAYLELRETAPGSFDVLFKTPMRGDARLALDVSFSGRAERVTPVMSRVTDNAMVQTWRLAATEPLSGQEVRIDGLASTMTDALVRIEFADGSEWTERLTPGAPRATIPPVKAGGRLPLPILGSAWSTSCSALIISSSYSRLC